MSGPSEGLTKILAVLDRMEIPYLIGGSVASSTHGKPRSTLDVDMVIDLRPDQVAEFAAALSGEFYLDEETIREALRRQRSFNLIHTASAYKFDFFPLRQDDYSRAAFGRRMFADIVTFGEPIECAVSSAEDTILRKLEWFRAGGESSEKQWSDIQGVLSITRSRLDYAYMRQWAKNLKVDDLLECLLAADTR